MRWGVVTHISIFSEFFQKLMVGDKLTRAHICKIQVFAKKMRDCASQIWKNYEPQISKFLKLKSAEFKKKKGGKGGHIFSFFSNFCDILWVDIN